MPETFGARLRRQREQRDVALATIADKTKIKKPLLEALERDDVSHWPAGIFRRAFVRAYAQEIGLDPDVVLREFLEIYPDPAEDVSPVNEAAAVAERAAANPPSRFSELFRSLIGRSAAPAPAPIHGDVHEIASSASAESIGPPRREPRREAALPEYDLTALAALCTEFGRTARSEDLSPLLQKAARVLNAGGLIVWKWDSRLERLRAHLAYGYSEAILSHLPAVTREANNATAAAFRSGQMSTVRGAGEARGALALPITGPQGCVGVLAIEFQSGHDASTLGGSIATIIAAQLGNFIEGQPRMQAAPARIAPPVVTGEMGLAV
jgi:transcriptional regulator with XRE-family HTH domain